MAAAAAGELQARQPALESFVRGEPLGEADVAQLRGLLAEHGTTVLDGGKVKRAGQWTGLFSATALSYKPEQTDFADNSVWVRENIFLAFALYALDPEGAGCAEAVECVGALAAFFLRHSSRFYDTIKGEADKADPMKRPHARFNGARLEEVAEPWNHKQNDALGYFLWLRCRLGVDARMPNTEDHLRLLAQIMEYLRKIEYWRDEDSGHWEEAEKVQASSIGAVLAGVREFKKLERKCMALGFFCETGTVKLLERKGTEALQEILPGECRQGGRARSVDAALLFLIYPLSIVSDEVALQILQRVDDDLTGSIGISRYRGDSFWCSGYKDRFGTKSTRFFSDDEIRERDELLRPGEEAQWMIFDPIVSVIHGSLYRKTTDPKHFQLQQRHLCRALAGITGSECTQGPWLCPRYYHLCDGAWRANTGSCPSLWAQANLSLALASMAESAALTSRCAEKIVLADFRKRGWVDSALCEEEQKRVLREVLPLLNVKQWTGQRIDQLLGAATIEAGGKLDLEQFFAWLFAEPPPEDNNDAATDGGTRGNSADAGTS